MLDPVYSTLHFLFEIVIFTYLPNVTIYFVLPLLFLLIVI